MRTVAIINQKGGSGKTTTAINLAAALARLDRRTLLADLDPQSHGALGLGIPEDHLDLTIADAMLQPTERPIDWSRLLWRVARNLDLAPSSARLAGLEAARGGLADREDRDLRLVGVLARLADQYDWCLIDCPPAVGLLTFNALRAADLVLIPVETAFFALHGAQKQIAAIKALARRMGAPTPYHVLPTMHDPGSTLAEDVLAQIHARMGEHLVPVVIRHDRKLKEAASLGLPVNEFDPDSDGAADYAALAAWLDERPRHANARAHHGAEVNGKADAAPAADEGPSVEVRVPAISRAAELAARARRLAQRSQELNARLDADPNVARVMRAIEEVAADPPEAEERDARLGRLYGARQTARGVLFVQPAAPTARIFVAGDHNNWSPTATPLRYNPSLGVHEACVPVPPGRCRYRLIVDGRWMADPHNPAVERNPFGECDSIIEVLPIGASAGVGAKRLSAAG